MNTVDNVNLFVLSFNNYQVGYENEGTQLAKYAKSVYNKYHNELESIIQKDTTIESIINGLHIENNFSSIQLMLFMIAVSLIYRKGYKEIIHQAAFILDSSDSSNVDWNKAIYEYKIRSYLFMLF